MTRYLYFKAFGVRDVEFRTSIALQLSLRRAVEQHIAYRDRTRPSHTIRLGTVPAFAGVSPPWCSRLVSPAATPFASIRPGLGLVLTSIIRKCRLALKNVCPAYNEIKVAAPLLSPIKKTSRLYQINISFYFQNDNWMNLHLNYIITICYKRKGFQKLIL